MDAPTEEAPPPEPGGWLAEHQRAHCAGSDAMSTYQGMLADELVLPQSAADAPDPAALVSAATQYARTMQSAAFFLPGEFAQEAMWSFHANDYVQQAMQGGHALYYDNRANDPIALRCASAGLKSMLADPHLELFESMLKLKRAKPGVARRAAAQAGHRSVAAALRDLDTRLAALEAREPLTPRHKTWLKSLRKTRIVPDAEGGAHLQRLMAANPLRARRREETERLRQVRERDDPAYRAAMALCEMAGLRFGGLGGGGVAPMRAVWPEGPDLRAYHWRVETDRGARAALIYREGRLFKRYLAVLMEQGGALPLGSLSLSKGEYEEIVPGAARGK